MEEGYHLFKFGRLGSADSALNPDIRTPTTIADVVKLGNTLNIQKPQTSSQENIM